MACVCARARVCLCLSASNGQSDPLGLRADGTGQLALDKAETTDDRVEILNASEELNKSWITKIKGRK